ncbi:hypothetical protein C922_02663 [Plasmodium inui San Antonio 1]|uniref:SAYSvFN domain-containing protein n=1 Tax=Plasmodium inui San Antonio 1 TaxID=1237626 RepID=W7ADG0_9APIC|nr:hypothetical protein C922_02663 [Plasmodium inui San Antonio 1]EUD67079.1 hypothetical protein C922_02663 [Plasmodium inui San Antonio 1]
MSKKKKSAKRKNGSSIVYYHPKITSTILLCSCYFFYGIFGVVYVILVLIAIIFLNLDHRNDDNGKWGNAISAYSIFNKGRKYLIGDLRMNQIEAELRNRNFKNDDSDDNFVRYDDIDKNRFYVKGSSKYNNKLCTCGSNKKFKKCCGAMKNNLSDY